MASKSKRDRERDRKRERIKKGREDPGAKLAKTLIPVEHVAQSPFVVCDVANHTEADQRASIRSGETRTVRKLTRVEVMHRAGVINADQVLACEWYAGAYEAGFGTIGCTANYTGAGGAGFGATDLLARYKSQAEAREDYYYAKAAIPEHLVWLFEAVVLDTGMPPPNMHRINRTRFSLAAFLLYGQIGHMLALAA